MGLEWGYSGTRVKQSGARAGPFHLILTMMVVTTAVVMAVPMVPVVRVVVILSWHHRFNQGMFS